MADAATAPTVTEIDKAVLATKFVDVGWLAKSHSVTVANGRSLRE